MARRDKPCTKEEFDNPNLISDKYPHVFIDGIEMTAENIWNWNGDREDLVDRLVDYFYNEGFIPYKELSDAKIEEQMLKLKDKDSSEVIAEDNQVKNSSSLCLDVCRHFCTDSFYDVKVNGLPSIKEVYRSKDLLKKVLQNRMGWYTSTETIKKKNKTIVGLHPCLFDISHKMVVQGCHSSMTSGNVSNFRPLIAKFLYERHCNGGNKVLDLSMGWGARFLAAWALDKTYYGIDPMTAKELEGMREFIKGDQKLCNQSVLDSVLCNGCSEDKSSYQDIPEVDYVIACPPYFKLEEYKCEKNSTDVHSEYQKWLEDYWKKTVQLMSQKLKRKGRFSLIMIDKWKKFNLLEDMSDIVIAEGFQQIEELSYKTMRSHLTNKRETGNSHKATEKIVTFEKK